MLLTRLLAVAILVFISGCSTTPVADISPGERPPNTSDVGGLWYVADKLERNIRTAPNRIEDPETEAYLQNLVCKLSQNYCKDIRVYLLDYPWFNAFMMPNGTMVIWSGLMLRAETESQLAFVLAHELGHFVRQHSIRSYRKQKNAERWLTALTIVSPAAGLLSTISATGVLLKYSRDYEREADEYSIEQLRLAGLNPASGGNLFKAVQEEDAASNREKRGIFFATHPTTKERIETISAANNDVDLREGGSAEFHNIKSKYADKWLQQELSKRNYAGTLVLLKNLRQSATPGSEFASQLDYYQGEVFRKRGDGDDLQNAKKYYNRSLSAATPNPVIYRKLGAIEQMLNQPLMAIDSYETYLRLSPNAKDTSQIKTMIQSIKQVLQ